MKEFDRKSWCWINIYEVGGKIIAGLLVLGGLIFGIVDAVDELILGGVGILVWLLVGIIFGAICLFSVMIVVNALSNLQIIREHIEKTGNNMNSILTDKEIEQIKKDRKDVEEKLKKEKEEHQQKIEEEKKRQLKIQREEQEREFLEHEKYVKENCPVQYEEIINFVGNTNSEDYKIMIENLYNSNKQSK